MKNSKGYKELTCEDMTQIIKDVGLTRKQASKLFFGKYEILIKVQKPKK